MKRNIAIVRGSFHQKESLVMEAAAIRTAETVNLNIVRKVVVPGSLELPFALSRLMRNTDIHGFVALGIIERGETGHGMVIGMSVMKALIDLQLQFGKPIGIGILGPDIFPSQIPSRLEGYASAAVLAVHAMLDLD